jgi:Tol biopolymer transport system component
MPRMSAAMFIALLVSGCAGVPGGGAAGAASSAPASPGATSTLAPSAQALPSFSRDEPLVLFGGLTGAGGGIFVSRPDGSGLQQLATDVLPGVHKSGDWSPDGQRVVFMDESTERMYIAHLDGSPTERLSVCDTAGCANPAWSPDGGRIAFSRLESAAGVIGPAAVGIYVVDVATGKVSRIVRLERPLLADVPRWSPDGQTILFGVDRMDEEANETGAAVAIVPVAGGKIRYLTDFALFGYVSDWGSSTNSIAFSVDVRGATKGADVESETWDLYLVRPDGTGLRRLTNAKPLERLRSPRWTPDGTKITAYDHQIPGGIIVDPATGTFQPFVTTGNFTRPMVRPQP